METLPKFTAERNKANTANPIKPTTTGKQEATERALTKWKTTTEQFLKDVHVDIGILLFLILINFNKYITRVQCHLLTNKHIRYDPHFIVMMSTYMP